MLVAAPGTVDHQLLSYKGMNWITYFIKKNSPNPKLCSLGVKSLEAINIWLCSVSAYMIPSLACRECATNFKCFKFRTKTTILT